MSVGHVLKRSFGFLFKQERAFKVNLGRNVSQNFLLTAAQQYQSIFIIALGARAVQLGLGTAVGGVASILAALLVGWLSSRYSIKSILMLGVGLIALGSFFFVTAVDWWMVVPALVVMTFALRVTGTVCPTICGSCFKSHERATGMALCDMVSSLPRLIAPIAAAYLVTVFGGLNTQGIRPLYLVQLAGLSLTFMMVWKLFEDPREIALARTNRTSNLGFVRSVRKLFSEVKHAKRWVVYMSLAGIPTYLGQIYWNLFAEQVKGANQYVIGQMTTAMWLIPVFLSFPMGRLADAVGRKRVIFLMMPLLLVSMFMVVYAEDSTGLVVSAFLQGTVGLISALQVAMTTEMVPPLLLSVWLSVVAMFEGLAGLVIAPAIGGLLWDFLSPVYVIVLMIIATAMTIPLLVLMPETLRKKSIDRSRTP